MPTFTNQASVRYRNTVTNSNIVTGNITENLTLSKDSIVSTYTNGGTVTYIVTVINSGNTSYTALNLTDDLGLPSSTGDTEPLTYVENSLHFYLNGILQTTPAVQSEGPLVISNINIPANSTGMFIYEATVNTFAPLSTDGSITNTATLTTGNDTLTATATITAENIAILSISKSICPADIPEDGSLTYTFVIQNSGNTATVATDEVVVFDEFNPILQNITVTYNGTILTETTDYTYENGIFQTLPGVIEVPAATYTLNAENETVITPGVSILTVTGTI